MLILIFLQNNDIILTFVKHYLSFFNMCRIILFLCFIFLIATLPAQTTNDEPDPNVFIPGAKQPKEINMSEVIRQIDYPAVAEEINLEMRAVFRVLIDENACYVRHLPPKSDHPIIVKHLEPYLPQIMFTPATKDGVPIKSWINVPFMFCRQE